MSAPVSFLTPRGSRSGGFENQSQRTVINRRPGITRATMPLGQYFDFESFVPGFSAMPSKLDGFLLGVSSGGSFPNSVLVPGALGLGLSLKGNPSANTGWISATPGRSDSDGATVAGWFQFLNEFTAFSTNAFCSINNVTLPGADYWNVRLSVVPAGFGTYEVLGELWITNAPSLPTTPSASLSLGSIGVGDWFFASARLNKVTGQATGSVNNSAATFSALVPASNSAAVNVNLEISSGLATAGEVFTMSFDELGLWPRALTDNELSGLHNGTALIPSGWPNVPAFPR